MVLLSGGDLVQPEQPEVSKPEARQASIVVSNWPVISSIEQPARLDIATPVHVPNLASSNDEHMTDILSQPPPQISAVQHCLKFSQKQSVRVAAMEMLQKQLNHLNCAAKLDSVQMVSAPSNILVPKTGNPSVPPTAPEKLTETFSPKSRGTETCSPK